jgi:predicted helicase
MQPFFHWTYKEQHLSNADNQTKGELFEQITESYLKYLPKYQVILKQVWRLKDIPLRNFHFLGIE